MITMLEAMTEQKIIQKLLENDNCFDNINVPRPNRIQLFVQRKQIEICAKQIKNNFHFKFISASSIEKTDSFEIKYYLLHESSDIKITLITDAPKDDPFFQSLVSVYSNAEWTETEIATIHPIVFIGHKNKQSIEDNLELYESIYDLDGSGL